MIKNDQVFKIIRYANVWEDTDIALSGLGIKTGQTGAAICSGGDNVLAMLTKHLKISCKSSIHIFLLFIKILNLLFA